MAQSNFTKETRIRLWLYRILDWCVLFLPVFVYIVMALADGGVTKTGKVTVVSTVMIALILTIFNIFRQKELRSPIWLVLIGLYVAVKEWLLPLIIILAITTIMDEMLFKPLIGYYKGKLIASKTYDERQEAEETQPIQGTGE